MSTCIIVPCYNEENRLPVEEFRDFVAYRENIDFLFVNDGSRDGTERLLTSLCEANAPHIFLLNLSRNSGKAEAVRQGCLKAFEQNYRYVGYWDADLATPLSAILELASILDDSPSINIVMGTRVKLLGRKIVRYEIRHYFGRVFATLASIILRLGVYDTQCGAKLFRSSEAIREVFQRPFLSRWAFDVELIARYLKMNPENRYSIYEYPLFQWVDIRGSKIRPWDLARIGYDLARIFVRYGIFRNTTMIPLSEGESNEK